MLKTFPRADLNLGHNPVFIKMQVNLKKAKAAHKQQLLDMSMLKQGVCMVIYNIAVRNRFNILCKEETEQYPKELENSNEQIERKGKDFRDCLQTAANELLLMKSKRNKNKGMTEDILHKMEQRWKYKNNNHIEYQRLNKEIANDCRKAKEQWLTEQCQEIEKLKKQYKTKEMHEKLQNSTHKKNTNKQASGIMSKDGNSFLNKKTFQRDRLNTYQISIMITETTCLYSPLQVERTS